MVHTDLLQAAKQVLPLLQLQNADNNLVSCSFSDLLLKERFLCQIMLIPVLQHEDVCCIQTQDFSNGATRGLKESHLWLRDRKGLDLILVNLF